MRYERTENQCSVAGLSSDDPIPLQTTPQTLSEIDAALRLGTAALIGLGIGLEREWSGHSTGPDARFAGIRTFLLLGMLGGVSGLFLSAGVLPAGALTLAAGFAMAIAAYVVTTRKPGADSDGTTETAALVVVSLGAVAGYGWLALAAGTGSIVMLVLLEKTRLHRLVRHVAERELQAALQFAVLALVILPLLPAGPFGGVLAIQPRSLWILVLIFTALNFAGYVARRALGTGAGSTVTGSLGGLISSTAVALDFARKSRHEPEARTALALGVIGACTVMIARVVVVSSVLNPRVGLQLCVLMVLPFVAGVLMLLRAARQFESETPAAPMVLGSPLRLWSALQMALVFQIALSALAMINGVWGTVGVYPAAAVLGLTDMDALTLSMSRLEGGLSVHAAAVAIAIGYLANTLLKAGITLAIGAGAFRAAAASRLLAQAVAGAVGIGLYFWWIQ